MISGELLQISVDYRPSLQTLHLGLFGSMTFIAAFAGYWVHQTRQTRGGNLLAVALFLLALRTGTDVIHGLVGELWTFQTLLVAVNPLIELCMLAVFIRFAGRYSGVRLFSSERTTWALVGIVVATLVIVTNPIHGLVFTAFQSVSMPFPYVGAQRGVVGVAFLAVNAVLLLAGAGLLAHAFTSGVRSAWWPSAVLSMAVSQAMLIGALQLTVSGVLPRYDYSAIGLGGFVLLSTLALLDHGLRRIEVIAREEILDEIDDAVVFLDDDGGVVEYNTAAEELFWGIETGERLTERFDTLEGVPPGAGRARTEVTLDRSELDPDRAASVSDEPGYGRGSRAGTDPETGSRHFLVHTSPVRAETTELLGYTVRLVDVTELKQRSLELKRKNEQLDQFASTVSHDLRNPLNVASGYLEMVSESVDSPDDATALDVEQAVTYLEKVEVSLDRMNAIIEDILALIENTGPVTETQTVAFEAVATAAWEAVDTRNATIHVDRGGRLEADPRRLQRLLENLFRNAIDHVGDDVAIETGLAGTTFYVADDGPGIPEDHRDQIFDHGYTTGNGGTGLGLSIVEQLAEAHGWTVTLDPDHDGACFVVGGCETYTSPDAADPGQ